MAGVMNFLSAPFFHKPAKPEPLATQWVVNVVYKLNTMTGSFLFLSSCILFFREIVSDHIHCFSDANRGGGIVDSKGFESYCYISSTFSLPRQPDEDLPDIHSGVRPIGMTSDNKDFVYHNYYMWVPYLLFFQSLTFFGPYLLHKFFQQGRLQLVIQELNNISPYPETRSNKIDDIATFFRDWYNHQTWWAVKLFLCDVSNFVVVILNLFLTDWYLGNQFMTYGPTSLDYIRQPSEVRRDDPFNLIFPKMTKCFMETFGPSGTIQRYDSLCVLTINVFNEKLYLMLWFVMVILAVVAGVYAAFDIVLALFPPLRRVVLMAYLSPDRADMRKKLARILDLTEYGDWMMFYLMAVNLDRVMFTDIVAAVEYPDYNWNAEPTDEENAALNTYHQVPTVDVGPNLDTAKPTSTKTTRILNRKPLAN